MFHDELKIGVRRKGVLLALVSATSLGLMGCGEQAAPPLKQEVVAPTPEQEFATLHKKAEAGDSTAQTQLGTIYAKGESVPEDVAKAFGWYQKAAAQGLAAAQDHLGTMYANGEGVSKDAAKAVEWYSKAAAQGYARGQYSLGWMYAEGEGVPQDFAKAAVLWEQAAAHGEASVQTLVAMSYSYISKMPRDLVKAFELFRKAAAQGDAVAQTSLGEIYAEGKAVPRDLVKAFEWHQKAADQGLATAQTYLGELYANGNGVPRSATKAFDWYQKAAVQGASIAQNAVGERYAKGDGVKEDLVLAYAWFNLAAKEGYFGAENRISIERLLSKQDLAEAQRLSSSWKKGHLIAREGSAANSNTSAMVSTPHALAKQGSSTAFFVNKLGHAITNHHVIDGCAEVRVAGRDGVTKVITSDAVNDLVLLQGPGTVKDFATINSDPTKLRQGDDIVVFGFPLNSLLSSGGNLTPGTVSAMTGLGNNTNQIQITASIQPGSSGSPVLNKKGEVVGVVSMKLSDSKMAKATGQVGQNVNFAVSGQTLKSFLDAHKIEYSKGGFMPFDKSTADLADEAKKWTTVVECWK